MAEGRPTVRRCRASTHFRTSRWVVGSRSARHFTWHSALGGGVARSASSRRHARGLPYEISLVLLELLGLRLQRGHLPFQLRDLLLGRRGADGQR